MRIACALVWLFLAVRPAGACGFWSMVDKEKATKVGYLINSASITKNEKRIGVLYFDIEAKGGMRVARDHKVIFDIKAGKLRKLGKVVATIDGDNLTFGKKTYTIELTNPHVVHDVMPAWTLAVKRGDEVIVEAEDASSLCSGLHKEMTATDSEEEVRRRVIYYLAWRELGG